MHVDIFEVQVPLQMEFEDEWVGRPFVLGTVLWVAAAICSQDSSENPRPDFQGKKRASDFTS